MKRVVQVMIQFSDKGWGTARIVPHHRTRRRVAKIATGTQLRAESRFSTRLSMSFRSVARAMAMILPSLLLGPQLACSDCQVSGQPVITYEGGKTSPGYYETSSWNDEWLYFPQGRTYRIAHGLGTDQYTVQLYLAFQPRPLDAGGSAPSAGNLGIVEKADAHAFQIRNDTCAELYVRAVAMTGSNAGLGGAGSHREP